MIFINVVKLKFAVGFVPLLFWACGGGQSPPANAQSSRQNVNQTKELKSDSVMNIRQGAVGKIGNYSVGVRSVDASTASVAVSNSALTPEKRNDYNIGFTVRNGDSIPIGNNFYRVSNIAGEEIQIENEPDKTAGIALQENALAVPDGGVLELHGFAVEVVSIESANGKTSAKIEIYSNDSPKQDLEKKNEIRKSTVSAGDEIGIGDRKHKVIAVHARKGNARGVVEISASPVR